MKQEPQLSTWSTINTKIKGIIPNDRVIDNAKLDEILCLYKDNCESWFGYFGRSFIKPQQNNGVQAKGVYYGQLHLENLIFSENFSIYEVSKKFENLLTISFANCTFKDGFYFDKTTHIYFQGNCSLEQGITTNTMDIIGKVSGQQVNFTSKIIFDLPQETDVEDFTVQLDTHKGSAISKFLVNQQEVTFKNMHCVNINLLESSKSFNFINCKITSIIIDTKNMSCPRSLTISKSEIDNLTFNNKGGVINSNRQEQSLMRGKIEIINNSKLDHFKCANIEITKEFFITDSTLGDVELGSNDFKGSFYIKNTTFKSSPNFLESTFSNNTIFEECEFKDTLSKNSVIKYRFLKNMVHGIGDEHQASIFQALEFKARRKNLKFLKGDAIEKTYSLFLCAFHNYGMSLIRPYIWLILFGIIFYYIYECNAGIECAGNISELKGWLSNSCQTDNYSDRAIYATFANSFGPVGIIIKNSTLVAGTFAMKIAETAQMILSSILWTIIITSARRRFKV